MNPPGDVHEAPWSWLLRIITVLGSLLLLGSVATMNVVTVPIRSVEVLLLVTQVLVALILPLCALTLIRGYRIGEGALWIRRWWWWTRVPLDGLREVEVVPNGMRGSIRLCGNGGLFSITGWYWNRRIGRFRAYITDPSRTVLLRIGEKKILVSPGDPERFAAELRALMPAGG